MANFTTLRINRAEPEIGGLSGDWLRVEQPEWPKQPAGGFLAWVTATGKGISLNTISEYFAQYSSHCEDDGCLTVEIQIHRSRPDLPYEANASYGKLSEKYIHQGSFKESRTVEKTASLDLEVQIVGKVSAYWEGSLFGIDGVKVESPPAIQVNGSVLSWGIELSGVLRVSYTEEHDAYTLTIVPREAGEYEPGSLENAYESTVFAVWAGGVETHEVDLPDMDGNCRAGERGIVDPDDPADDQCVRHNILVDACDLSIIREWDEVIPCPG